MTQLHLGLDHAHRVFRDQNVTVADDRNVDGLFNRRNARPIGGTGVPLLARAWMQSDGLQAFVLNAVGVRDDR